MLIRKYIYLALGIAVLAGIGTAARATWKAGYNAARAEAAVVYQQQLEVARLEWERASEVAREQILNELRIAQRTRGIEAAIPGVVDSLAEQCRDLGADFMRLFNDAIGDTGATNAASAAESVD